MQVNSVIMQVNKTLKYKKHIEKTTRMQKVETVVKMRKIIRSVAYFSKCFRGKKENF